MFLDVELRLSSFFLCGSQRLFVRLLVVSWKSPKRLTAEALSRARLEVASSTCRWDLSISVVR